MGSGFLSKLKSAGIDGTQAVRGIVRGNREVTGYGDVDVLDADNGLNVGRNAEPPGFNSLGPALISATGPEGEADFTGPRYWINWLIPLATNDDGRTGVLSLGITDLTETNIALNLCEVADRPLASATEQVKGCHLLDALQPVWVYAVEDDSGQARLVILERPQPRVRITNSTACGKAYYNGTVIKRPIGEVDKSIDLTSAALGTDGPAVIIRNRQEINRTTADPWLTHADNTDQKEFAGQLAYINADGMAVVEINAAWFDPCE